MSTSPAILFFGTKFIPAQGLSFKTFKDGDSETIVLSKGSFSEPGNIDKIVIPDYKETAIILASSNFAYASNEDGSRERTSVLRDTLPQIFQSVFGEVAFKSIDNPLPVVVNLKDAIEQCSISPYILIKKTHVSDEEELVKELKQLQGVEITDHGDFYEIALGETPFGNILTADNNNFDYTLNSYYTAMKKALGVSTT